MLKSTESNIRAFVKFTNTSGRFVEVQWLNYKGENVHYTKLKPNQSCTIDTFCTHPWIFVCPLTGELLQVNNKNCFLPEPWVKYIKRSESGAFIVGRQEVAIHYPLRSLRDVCMWRLNFLVKTRDNINSLEVPETVKADLLNVFDMSWRFTDNSEITPDMYSR